MVIARHPKATARDGPVKPFQNFGGCGQVDVRPGMTMSSDLFQPFH